MPETFTFGDMLSARSVIGETLAAEGAKRDNLWVLTPDIGATLVEFRDTFPDRFIDVGLAEQACVGIAAGLAYDGNISVVSGMLPFLSMRALEQVRSDVCYPNLPVKIIGTHGGLVGNGGSTHYAVEDLSLMASLTNMTVTSIGDPVMVGEVLRQSMEMSGPIYIRLAVGKKDKVLYAPGEHDIRIGR
ncbi:MAG: transketolase family protein, partial [Microbacterium sp.]